MEHTPTPTAFYKARLTWNATRNGWDITRVDGLVYQFTAAGNIGAVAHLGIGWMKFGGRSCLLLCRAFARNKGTSARARPSVNRAPRIRV
jgi:hypothetical protein